MGGQILLPFVLLAAALFFLARRRSSKSKLPLPPGPATLPIIGNLHQMGDPFHKVLHKLSQQHGDLMLIKFGNVNSIVISSADLTREVIKNHDITFGDRAVRKATRRMSYDVTDITFAPYGEYWREVRKIAVLELLSPKRVQSYRPAREDEVKVLRDAVLRTNSEEFDLTELLHTLSNNLLCRVAFGRKFVRTNDGKKTPQELLQETQTLVGTICLSDFFPFLWWLNKLNGYDARVEKNFHELDEVFETVIQEHMNPNRQKPDGDDIVDVLLKIQSDKTRTVSHTPSFVKAIISDMFIAGTDTTAASLIWAMTELIRSPRCLQRATDEVREICKGKKEVSEEELSQLPYIKAVIKETMRLHPPTPLLIPRETSEECELRGYRIPAKATVFINAYSMAVDSRSWERAEDFWPERFMESTMDFRGQHFELIPFGVGRRACPGLGFASVTVESVVANLLFWFDWELPRGVTADDVDMADAIGIVVLKKTPLRMVAKRVNI